MPPVLQGKVALFGAAGPVAVTAADALRDHYTLRLCDVRLLAERTSAQSPGAPLPGPVTAPHEERLVDITDYAQVLEASRGMDALINCTVVRPHLEAAFLVNTIGAYHVAKAAVELGIRRVIHSGPQLVIAEHQADYWHDFDVHDDVPERPGSNLYGLSKYLGSEIMRRFAEQHGLEVAAFVYAHFRPADRPEDADGSGLFAFTTAWEDTGGSFLAALRAPSAAFERPFELFHIASRLPHGKIGGSDKTQRLLGWVPEHDFARLWHRPAVGRE
jgi:nucleoside-diphosphate-sugar epimerase